MSRYFFNLFIFYFNIFAVKETSRKAHTLPCSLQIYVINFKKCVIMLCNNCFILWHDFSVIGYLTRTKYFMILNSFIKKYV